MVTQDNIPYYSSRFYWSLYIAASAFATRLYPVTFAGLIRDLDFSVTCTADLTVCSGHVGTRGRYGRTCEFAVSVKIRLEGLLECE